MKDFHGGFLIDKPSGITSFDVLRDIKRAIGVRDLKIGHTGTLDPFATGLLLVLLGNAVKLSEFFLHSDKEYLADLVLGRKTESGDLTNEVIEIRDVPPRLTVEKLQVATLPFTSTPYLQIPPMYSAKKKDGKNLYELARQGITVEREAVSCSVREFEILEYLDPNLVCFRAAVSSGTYIRTLGEDFAQGLGTLGALRELRRTRVGRFDLKEAVRLPELCAALRTGSSVPHVSMDDLLADESRVTVTEEEAEDLLKGLHRKIPGLLPRLSRRAENGRIFLFHPRGGLFGILLKDPETGHFIPRKYFPPIALP